MPTSKVEMLVLGMLAEEPMYGYEVLERLRRRGAGEWAGVGRASIYQALRRLERQGHATVRAESGEQGPDRRTYRLTRSGRARLAKALAEGLEPAGPYEVDASLALAFSHLLDPADVRAVVTRREAAIRERRTHLAGERGRLRASTEAWSAVAVRLLEQQDAFATAELATLAAIRRDLSRTRR